MIKYVFSPCIFLWCVGNWSKFRVLIKQLLGSAPGKSIQKFKNEFASCSEWKSWLAIYLKISLAHFTVKGEGSLKIWTEKAETRGCSITFGSKPSGLQVWVWPSSSLWRSFLLPLSLTQSDAKAWAKNNPWKAKKGAFREEREDSIRMGPWFRGESC